MEQIAGLEPAHLLIGNQTPYQLGYICKKYFSLTAIPASCICFYLNIANILHSNMAQSKRKLMALLGIEPSD